jgi:hypothetical protein
LAEDYAGVLSVIRYHVWWPSSSDPYYQFNTPENTTRNNYYQNNYTPHLFVDGNIDAGSDGWENPIDQESFNSSPLVMQLWGFFDRDTRQGALTVQIYVESDPVASTLRLRIAMVEDDIYWHSPNGTNWHNQTFRDMIPSTYGEPLTLVVGDTVEYTYDFTADEDCDVDNCKFVAFVQSNNNRYILQGARIAVSELTPVPVDDEERVPEQFTLHQNYPNPFNAQTKIEFETSGGHATLEVFDITGARVSTLVNQNLGPGRHEVIWDGRDRNGKPVSSGVYFYRLKSAGNDDIRKMALLK